MREDSPGNCQCNQRQNSNGAAMPALLALACHKRKRQQNADAKNWSNEDERCLKTRRKIGEYRIQPEEEEVWLRNCLDDRRIRLSAWPIGPEDDRAHRNRRQNGR